jgi:phosphoribosylamine---glycine ligase
MNKNFVIIGGGGGRESALLKMAVKAGFQCYALTKVINPSILECCTEERAIKGEFTRSYLESLLERIDENDEAIFWVSSDEALGAGIVDILRELGIPPKSIIGPTQEAAKIETDKVFSIKLVKELFPEITPEFRVVESAQELDKAIDEFIAKKTAIVVKPIGLTGGKGVKVMPIHLASYSEAKDYALQCLKSDGVVLLVEKLSGIEITIMGITDGESLFPMPVTYDNPYRFAGDKGPGTGGMGSFNYETRKLAFMSDEDLYRCNNIMQGVITKLKSLNLHFSGALYGSFFLTDQGIKFLEFNARFGDPECMNFALSFVGDFNKLVQKLSAGSLEETDLVFHNSATLVKYLVHPKYCLGGDEPVDFYLDVDKLSSLGVEVFFASCEKVGESKFRTVGTSRTVALGCVGESVESCSEKINSAISLCLSGELDYRDDIGSNAQLNELFKIAL